MDKQSFFRQNILAKFDELNFKLAFGNTTDSLTNLVATYSLNAEETTELIIVAIDLLEMESMLSLLTSKDPLKINKVDSTKYGDLFDYFRELIESSMTSTSVLQDYKVSYMNIKKLKEQKKARILELRKQQQLEA